jgi:DNA-binding CsgD family transcriptional regulator
MAVVVVTDHRLVARVISAVMGDGPEVGHLEHPEPDSPVWGGVDVIDRRSGVRPAASTPGPPLPQWQVLVVTTEGDEVVGQPLSDLLEFLRPLSRPSPVVSDIELSTPLTNRELEVLEALGAGYTPAAIARALCLSAHTVRNHIRHVLAKLGAHTQLEAVTIAARRGILVLGGTGPWRTA